MLVREVVLPLLSEVEQLVGKEIEPWFRLWTDAEEPGVAHARETCSVIIRRDREAGDVREQAVTLLWETTTGGGLEQEACSECSWAQELTMMLDEHDDAYTRRIGEVREPLKALREFLYQREGGLEECREALALRVEMGSSEMLGELLLELHGEVQRRLGAGRAREELLEEMRAQLRVWTNGALEVRAAPRTPWRSERELLLDLELGRLNAAGEMVSILLASSSVGTRVARVEREVWCWIEAMRAAGGGRIPPVPFLELRGECDEELLSAMAVLYDRNGAFNTLESALEAARAL